LEVFVWIAIFLLWILFLPAAIVVVTPIILIISSLQKKPAKPMFIRFIEWWTDFLPALPDFQRNKKNIDPSNREGREKAGKIE